MSLIYSFDGDQIMERKLGDKQLGIILSRKPDTFTLSS